MLQNLTHALRTSEWRFLGRASVGRVLNRNRIRTILGLVVALAVSLSLTSASDAGQRRNWRDANAAFVGGKSFSGKASFYSTGQKTATGARFNPHGMTAAHRTLPFGTKVRVTDAHSGRSVVVTIIDRGPFIRGRVLDLSLGAARAIGLTGRGVGHVHAEVL